MTKTLLPQNTTKLERDLELLMAHSSDLPVAINTLWDPMTCPLTLLPWLAWANSVDDWLESWPEAVKRKVIADAFDVHRYKGTPHAVQKALDSLGVKTNILEWWEAGGSGQNGTMVVSAMLNENITGGEGLVNARMLRLITTAIKNSKRGSIHFDLELGIYFEEQFNLSAGLASGVGISCASPEFSAVIPDDLSAKVSLAGVTHALNCADTDAAGAAVLPEELNGQQLHSAAIHQLALSSVELVGVS